MFDTTEELLAQIRVGEDSTLETKELRFKGNKIIGPDKDSIAAEMSAMANSIGGVLVLGVADKSKDIVGIPMEQLENVEQWIRQICADSITPQLECSLRKIIVPVEDGEVVIIRIDIPKSLFIHRSPIGYYTRVGSSKREMSPDLLARMFQQRSQVRMVFFDEQAVPGTSIQDLSEKFWKKFLPDAANDSDETFLRKLRLLTTDTEGHETATVSGILIASQRPDKYLTSAKIQAVCYRGTLRDSAYQIDAKEIVGPIDVQVVEACSFVQRNMRMGAIKNPMRIEKPQFAERAVFEAIVNAVAHRDYSIQQSCIRLHMFADRLEIYSPGAIPNTMTIESMPLRQFSRNELLSSLLARCPVSDKGVYGRAFMMDRRGEGVPIIISETRRATGLNPVFEMIDDAEVLVSIPAREC